MSIRKASVPDIPLVRELALKVWPETYTPILGNEQVSYMLDLFYSPDALSMQMESGHRFVLCYRHNAPVAFASYSEAGERLYKLQKIYVLPDLQGRGAGRFIVAHVAGELISAGALKLQLNVNRYNTKAIAFYEKTGFRTVKEEDIDIGNGYFMNDYVMELALQH